MDADFRVLDSDFLDVSYNAIQFVSEWAVKDLYGIENVTVKDVRVDGAGTNVINARAFGHATFENVDALRASSHVSSWRIRRTSVNGPK